MPTLYVARSQNLQKWGSDVGLTEHLYKVGVAADSAEEAVESLNTASFAGETDWRLLKAQATESGEPAVLEKLTKKEKLVDPGLYPKIRGANGILKVKLANVQSRLLVQKMMAGDEEKVTKKPKPAEIADYLVQDAVS